MTSHLAPYRGTRLRVRLAALAAAGAMTVGLVSGLLLSFDARSPGLWLAPTPELMEMVADCDRHTHRSVRERCRQSVVAARLAHDRNASALARR